MCIITMSTLGGILGMTTAAISSATAASATGISALGVATGAVNALAGLGLVGGALSGIVGGIQSGKAAQAEAEYQANINRQNAQIAQDNAKKERQQGLEDARRQRMKTIQAIGEQKVNIAANGAEIGSGTAIDTIEDTAMLGELDALNIQYNAEQRALNFDQQTNNFNNQANLDILKGQNAARTGQIKAVSAGLNGLSSSINTFASGGFGFNKKGNVNSFNRKYKNTYAVGDSAFV